MGSFKICALYSVPTGLEDVSTYPNLLEELLKNGTWTEQDLKKLIGINFLRVFRQAESVSGFIFSHLAHLFISYIFTSVAKLAYFESNNKVQKSRKNEKWHSSLFSLDKWIAVKIGNILHMSTFLL